MILDYNDWKDEIERFSIEEFGSIEATVKYNTMIQNKLDIHMTEYSLKCAGADPLQKKAAMKESKSLMQRYTRELRS